MNKHIESIYARKSRRDQTYIICGRRINCKKKWINNSAKIFEISPDLGVAYVMFLYTGFFVNVNTDNNLLAAAAFRDISQERIAEIFFWRWFASIVVHICLLDGELREPIAVSSEEICMIDNCGHCANLNLLSARKMKIVNPGIYKQISTTFAAADIDAQLRETAKKMITTHVAGASWLVRLIFEL